MRFGLIVDSHGASLKQGVDFLNNENVDFVLVNGDMQGYSKESNLEQSLRELTESKSDVYVIPGTHEDSLDYNEKMKAITAEFEHIKNNGPSINKTNPNQETVLISYGGSTGKALPQYGSPYIVNPLLDVSKIDTIMELTKNIKEIKDIILQTHEPPKFYGDITGYVSYDGKIYPLAALKSHPIFDELKQYAVIENAGDKSLTDLIEGKGFSEVIPRVVTFGHIHECPEAKEIPTRNKVKPGKKVKNLAINPGPYREGNVAVISVEDNEASYNVKNLKE